MHYCLWAHRRCDECKKKGRECLTRLGKHKKACSSCARRKISCSLAGGLRKLAKGYSSPHGRRRNEVEDEGERQNFSREGRNAVEDFHKEYESIGRAGSIPGKCYFATGFKVR